MKLLIGIAAALALPAPAPAVDKEPPPRVHELTTFAAPGCAGACGSGSTIGPDRALYVTDGPGGRVLRIDPRTGAMRTFAHGLPPQAPDIGLGGAIDVEFVGRRAYVLVTLAGVSGVYRVERDGSATVVADLGAWSIAHPPATDFFVPGGVQYALERYRGDLLVSDGHHNRVLRVSRTGEIRELMAFGNVVPTGLDVYGRSIYVAQAGPIPHRPGDGKVVRLGRRAITLASVASLLVDVEWNRWRLYALSQGRWDLPPTPENEGKPATPGTGRIVRFDGRRLVPVVSRLDRPTSFELVGNSAYVVTLTGKVIRVDHL